MDKQELLRKVEANEGLTVAEVKAYQEMTKPIQHVYGKYGTLAKKFLEEHNVAKYWAIENACNLDQGSLIRYDGGYYAGTKDGCKVELYIKRVEGGNIKVYERRDIQDYEEDDLVRNDLSNFLHFLAYHIMRRDYNGYDKKVKWKISLYTREIEIPLTSSSYNELFRALEKILDELP